MKDRQIVFVNEYLKCWNSAEAARRAGYSEKTARSIGQENLTKPDIKALIKERLNELTMSADEVLVRLTAQGRANIADFADIQTNDDLSNLGDKGQVIKKFRRRITRTQAGGEYEDIELELYDAQAALKAIREMRGMDAAAKVEHSGPGGGPIEFTQVEVQLDRNKPVED